MQTKYRITFVYGENASSVAVAGYGNTVEEVAARVARSAENVPDLEVIIREVATQQVVAELSTDSTGKVTAEIRQGDTCNWIVYELNSNRQLVLQPIPVG